MLYLVTSDPALWHNEHVTRQQLQVLLHLAAVDESIQLELYVLLLAIDGAGNMRAIAGCELPQSPDCEQGVQNRHAVPVGQGLWLHHLAYHLDLTENADRDRDDD